MHKLDMIRIIWAIKFTRTPVRRHYQIRPMTAYPGILYHIHVA